MLFTITFSLRPIEVEAIKESEGRDLSTPEIEEWLRVLVHKILARTIEKNAEGEVKVG